MKNSSRSTSGHLALLMALASCDSPTAPSLPAGAVRFTPPSIYRQWWALTEQCSGRQGTYDAIAWYVVPDVSTLPGTKGLSGYWYADNRIVLAGAYDGIAAGDLVRHEMLHALLGPGVNGHPRDMFVRRCDGVVVCEGECLSDGGPAPAPDPAARLASASTLEVSVDVVPPAPGSTTWDGYFMMIIHAHNPAGYPIVTTQRAGFGYQLRAQGTDVEYGLPVEAPEETRFAAGETKSFIFDFHIVSDSHIRYDIAPDTWTFNGSYGGVWAPSPPTVTVSP